MRAFSFGAFLLGLAFLFWVQTGLAVRIVSQPLSAVVARADVIVVGEITNVKSTLHSYEYGRSSKSWDEISVGFLVKEVLKGSWPGKAGSGTYTLPSFVDYNEPGSREQECPVIDGSGYESELRKSETWIFLFDTNGGSRTILRVEPVASKDEVLGAIRRHN
jgi:hypothetical protein